MRGPSRPRVQHAPCPPGGAPENIRGEGERQVEGDAVGAGDGGARGRAQGAVAHRPAAGCRGHHLGVVGVMGRDLRVRGNGNWGWWGLWVETLGLGFMV